MAYCNGCGTSIPSTANFCQKCGAKVSDLRTENHRTDELSSATNEQNSSSAPSLPVAFFNYPKRHEEIECVSCSQMYRADLLRACPKCGTISMSKFASKVSNYKTSSRYERQSYESKSGKFKWVIGFALILIAVVYVLNSNSNGGVTTNQDSETSQGGYWVSKCRTIQERNPNWPDSPPRVFIQKQCTDVWVDN